MDKTSVVVSCPIDTYSGYGARSRDLVKALIALGKYDVKILAQRCQFQSRPRSVKRKRRLENATSLQPKTI